MIAYQKERLENAISFFARKIQEIAHKPAYQTYIYKYLALFDFRMLKKRGTPALGIDYDAFEKGPVPKDLYDNIDILESKYFKVNIDNDGNYYFESTQNPDLDYFSPSEITTMTEIVNQFIRQGMTTREVIEATHQEIKAWQKAWKNRGDKGRVRMKYEDSFENIANKDTKNITPEEEAFLIYNGFQKLLADASRNGI